MTKERRLGRGLEALLGRLPQSPEGPEDSGRNGTSPNVPADNPAPPQEPADGPPAEPPAELPAVSEPIVVGPPEATPVEPPRDGVARLPVEQIDRNPAQPRQDFDDAETQALAESLHAHGLLQPVVVRRLGERYQLIAGERRLRAATEAGWSEVPANIIEADDRTTAELAIIENLQRKDLNPLEKAASFQRYLEQYGCKQEELASRLKIDRSTIANLIRLLELPEPIQQALRAGAITQGHARALLPLGEEREQIDFCGRIQREGLSVRATESLVQETIASADQGPLGVVDRQGRQTSSPRPKSDHLAALEQEFRAALGMKVKLTHNARGRGKLTIQFNGHEEFERIRAHICAPTPQPRRQAG